MTEQLRFTVPEKPPVDESSIASVAEPPAELIVSELGEIDSVTVEPVPDNETVCGAPLALSVMVRVPVRAPPAVGVKVTEMAQLAAAATLDPQVLVSAKSPVATIDVMLNAAEPLSVSVTVCAALVEPVFCAEKLRLAAESEASGPAGFTVIVTVAVAEA